MRDYTACKHLRGVQPCIFTPYADCISTTEQRTSWSGDQHCCFIFGRSRPQISARRSAIMSEVLRVQVLTAASDNQACPFIIITPHPSNPSLSSLCMTSFLTCCYHLHLGHLLCHFPFTFVFKTCSQILSSVITKICPYHLILFICQLVFLAV
jgi:hypothetical protein